MIIRKLSQNCQRELVKFYYDFKSPYTYLAWQPTLQLEKEYPIRLRFLPWPFRPEESFGGKLEERTRLNWNKVRYLYLDCRRFANERGMIIRGPERLFDSRLALIASLYAEKHQCFHPFAQTTFERFFQRKLNLENVDELFQILVQSSKDRFSIDDFQKYLDGEGAKQYDEIQKEAEKDQVFGIPMLILRGEPFWGYDRLPELKKRLDALFR